MLWDCFGQNGEEFFISLRRQPTTHPNRENWLINNGWNELFGMVESIN